MNPLIDIHRRNGFTINVKPLKDSKSGLFIEFPNTDTFSEKISCYFIKKDSIEYMEESVSNDGAKKTVSVSSDWIIPSIFIDIIRHASVLGIPYDLILYYDSDGKISEDGIKPCIMDILPELNIDLENCMKIIYLIPKIIAGQQCPDPSVEEGYVFLQKIWFKGGLLNA
jgi:hypothetical protein